MKTEIIKSPYGDYTTNGANLIFVSKTNEEDKIYYQMYFKTGDFENEKERYANLLKIHKKKFGIDLENDYYLAKKVYLSNPYADEDWRK